jgi:hypothetical protein
MKLRFLIFALALLAPVTGAAEPAKAPSAPYGSDARVAYIEGALGAFAESSPAELHDEMERARTLARGACAAGEIRLRIECLLVAMGRYCADRGDAARRCRLTLDVVASNVLADERLIPPAERYRILRDNADYRAALAHELRRIQGALAVDFRLHEGELDAPHAMAVGIDRYCLSSADETKFPYPTCVSSLVWFIRGPQ